LGFLEEVQTKVISIYTGKEDAEELDDILSCIYPINNDDTFYVSYRSGLDDDSMKRLYKAQNQWLQEVEVINLVWNAISM
jgi:hypothetical protein